MFSVVKTLEGLVQYRCRMNVLFSVVYLYLTGIYHIFAKCLIERMEWMITGGGMGVRYFLRLRENRKNHHEV